MVQKQAKGTDLPFQPGRDPLAGLENHPLFRDIQPETSLDQANSHALRLAHARLRKAEQEIKQLREQIEATEQEKRRLLRHTDDLQQQLSSLAKNTPKLPTPVLADWEALFTGELQNTKITFNNIPLELKAFLTATKAVVQAETGLQLTERDQVVCALAAYRMLLQSHPNTMQLVRGLPNHNAAAQYCVRLLAYLAQSLSSVDNG